MSDDISPEMFERIDRWLDTEQGRRYIELIDRRIRLGREQREILEQFVVDLTGPTVEKDELYREVGKFIVSFSHLETMLRFLIGIESKVQSSFKEAFMLMFDFANLVQTLSSYYKENIEDEIIRNRILKLLKKCHSMNQNRVKIAHGTWYFNNESRGSLVHMKRGGIKSQEYFNDINEIKLLNKKITEILKELIEFQAEKFEMDEDIIPQDSL